MEVGKICKLYNTHIGCTGEQCLDDLHHLGTGWVK